MFFFKAPKSIKRKGGSGDQLSHLDLPGTAIFIPAVICALLALQWGGTKYPWHDAHVIVLFAVFIFLTCAFIGVQLWQKEKATVAPRLIKNRNLWGSAFFAFCVGATFSLCTYYLPIWFQAVKNASPIMSSVMNLPMILVVVIFSLLAGGLITWTNYYTPVMILSSVLLTIGAGLLTTLKMDVGPAKWLGYQALFGIGLGLGIQQPMVAVQTSLSAGDVPSATARVMFAQTLGGAIFVAVGQSVFANQLVNNTIQDAPGIDLVKVAHVGATTLREVVSEDVLPAVLRAYSSSITETFYVGVATGGLSIVGALVIEWISLKGKKIDMN